MKPEDAISKHYDVAALAGDAVREAEALVLVANLEVLFEGDKARPVGVDKELGGLFHRANDFTTEPLFKTTSQDMSEPYESFVQDGVTMVSRIIRLGARPTTRSPDSAFVDSQIYLVGLMGEEQQSVTTRNCPFAILTTSKGTTEFFKIDDNPNLGEIVVTNALKDGESERVLAEQGNVDRNKIKLTVLSPEERYQVSAELEKALKALAEDTAGSTPTS